MKKMISATLLTLLLHPAICQDFRWQQRAEYTMEVLLDTKTHKLTGEQQIVYYNNSPDTLTKVYYHLYFNAFQPGSMMDVRSRTIVDPDKRIGDRISKLNESEIGYQKVNALKQDGKEVTTTVEGTLLKVALAKPILPRSKTILTLNFEAQVPIQIRRSGRDNKEGIAYSMTQWYPKLAEYDQQGWHAYQYVAREFHGIWGDFDVSITIAPSFTVAGTGVLQNPDQIGHGYQKSGSTVGTSTRDLTWRFIAKNVIDFAWAADTDYTHDRMQVPGGPELHFFYQRNDKTKDSWKSLQPIAVGVFQFLSSTFGKYPFETYSIIQGGDGGMEYPMCTLILGEGKLDGVAGTMAHEVAHSWYQMVLATNESLYAWLDEGFTDFASDEALAFITQTANDHKGSYNNYYSMVNRGLLELPSQHSDHFVTNSGYRTGSYTAGAIFLHQLKYIIGTEPFYAGMKQYYNTWKFRHPEPNDFIRIMEKVSGMQLHWYLRYWIYTTKKIDYEIAEVSNHDGKTSIRLNRLGEFPMPIDLLITYTDGSTELIYIPTNETLGSKANELLTQKFNELPAWAWVSPSYSFLFERKTSDIESVEIDPSQRMADINRKNNKVVLKGHSQISEN
jgi:Peptidase family M1 domain